MKIISYLVLGANGKLPLVDLVNELIEEGWEPQGGVMTEAGAFYQAMIYKTRGVEND